MSNLQKVTYHFSFVTCSGPPLSQPLKATITNEEGGSWSPESAGNLLYEDRGNPAVFFYQGRTRAPGV